MVGFVLQIVNEATCRSDRLDGSCAPGICPRGGVRNVAWLVWPCVTPVANVGGEIVGIRLLTQRSEAGTTASASAIASVEVVLTLAAQYVFVIVGVIRPKSVLY
jgi:hypothetical protein